MVVIVPAALSKSVSVTRDPRTPANATFGSEPNLIQEWSLHYPRLSLTQLICATPPGQQCQESGWHNQLGEWQVRAKQLS